MLRPRYTQALAASAAGMVLAVACLARLAHQPGVLLEDMPADFNSGALFKGSDRATLKVSPHRLQQLRLRKLDDVHADFNSEIPMATPGWQYDNYANLNPEVDAEPELTKAGKLNDAVGFSTWSGPTNSYSPPIQGGRFGTSNELDGTTMGAVFKTPAQTSMLKKKSLDPLPGFVPTYKVGGDPLPGFVPTFKAPARRAEWGSRLPPAEGGRAAVRQRLLSRAARRGQLYYTGSSTPGQGYYADLVTNPRESPEEFLAAQEEREAAAAELVGVDGRRAGALFQAPGAAVRARALALKRYAGLGMPMLFCPRDGSGGSHCGYGGVDTSEEAYADPDPLAIIGEQVWHPGPTNYGPDSPAVWLPEEDMLDDPTLVRQVWPDWPPPSKKR